MLLIKDKFKITMRTQKAQSQAMAKGHTEQIVKTKEKVGATQTVRRKAVFRNKEATIHW